MNAAEVGVRADALLDELERAVVGKRATLRLLLQAVLAGGHVLLEDVPGVAKTLIARSFAAVTEATFARVQFTPDLLPADVTGTTVLEPGGGTRFRPGPIFANVLLGDEINRAPPKTQAALLEAMEERQVTADDGTHPLPQPFIVIATQNPVELEGTYPLPEAQVDRFMVRLAVGYPAEAEEVDLLLRRAGRTTAQASLARVVALDELRAMQAAVEGVHVDADVAAYVAAIARATREAEGVLIGASPRGALALLQLARAGALLDGRGFVLPDDVKAAASPALAHRLVLRPELWIQQASAADLVARVVGAVPAPVIEGRP
jgi:MoxR-like ATPase